MARQTPNAILKARGSKKVRKEVEAPTGQAAPTYALSPEGQRAWDRIAAIMTEMKIISPSYAELMTITAGACGDIEIANADLMKRGYISITERGETKNPSFTMKTSAQTAAQKGLTALGLTPTNIGKIIVADKEDINPFTEFLKG